MRLSFSPEQIPEGEIAGIAYEFKGNAHKFKYATSSIKDYCYYEQDIAASDEWTTIIIPLEALVQPAWGKKAPFYAKDLNALLWIGIGKTGDTGNITIDNVRFYKK